MSRAGNCTQSAKGKEAFLKCNLKKAGGLGISRVGFLEPMSHAETRVSQVSSFTVTLS
jgi:hypothetical protein